MQYVELGDIPLLYGIKVRREYLFNQDPEYVGQFEECFTSTVSSIGGWAIAFNIQLANGAQFARIPIHALVTKEDAPVRQHYDLQLWDCFGETFSIYSSDIHQGCRVEARLPCGETVIGKYLWTIVWQDSPWSMEPSQNKQGHFLLLEEGNFALLPNNATPRWHLPWFVDTKLEIPRYKANCRTWSVESDRQLVLPEPDNYHYLG